MARKRVGLGNLNKATRTAKKRTNRVRTGLDQRLLVSYPVYIGERTSSSGRKTPIIGTINEGSLRKLNLKLGELQKFPDSTYVSPAGLKIKYIFKDNLLWKETTGKSGDIDYNSVEPVPVATNPAKLEITLQGSKETGNITASIGIPSLTSVATVGEFVAKLKLDKNGKALRWKWGKNSVTLRELGKKSGGSRKRSTEPEWYVPIGYDSSTRLTKDGSKSKGIADTKKTLIVASMTASTAELLGLTKESETNASDLKKSNIKVSVDNNAVGGRAKGYDVFGKLNVYSAIWADSSNSEKAVLLDPGTAMSVKVRFTKFKKGEALGNISKSRTERNVTSNSTSATFLLPAGIPIGIVFEMLMNAVNRPTSFQVSSDKKSYGKSYRLPSKTTKR